MLFCLKNSKVAHGETYTMDSQVVCAVYKNNTPSAYYLYPRSSISKTPLRLANSVGIIDSGYRGNLMASFYNTKDEDVIIKKGDRIVQICMPNLESNYCLEIKERLDSTERGEGGLGSTGE